MESGWTTGAMIRTGRSSEAGGRPARRQASIRMRGDVFWKIYGKQGLVRPFATGRRAVCATQGQKRL